MLNIFRNLKKYWYLVLLILALLFVQAYCDLSLPDYTSVLIDVGIANSGIEYAVPQYISKSGFMEVQLFLTEEEKQHWNEAYAPDGDRYALTSGSQENWSALDEEFSHIIAVVYMMTSQAGSETEGMDFSAVNFGNMDMSALDPTVMTPEQLQQLQTAGQMLAELGVDITSPTLMLDLRQVFEEKLSTLGDSIISSMAKQFAREQYEQCGIDLDKMQTDYLWVTGLKMMAMALIMAVVAIIIGFVASKIAAGVGRDLRGNVFRKVMGFGNAELDKFSTASLITRSTNDVQQIQFATVMLLRMVLYAPILAIGGIINISRYDSGMNWIIVLAIAVVFCLILLLLALTMPKFKIMQKLVDRVNLVAREILTGIPVIRAFGREEKENERFDEANTHLTKVMLYVNRIMSVMMPTLMIVMNGVSALIIWVAAQQIDAGVLEVGAMTAFITYAMIIIMGFLMLTAVSIMLPRAGVAADRIQEVLDTEPSIKDKEGAAAAKTAPAENAAVRFDHVSFKYPDGGENVLTDIDFIAEPGKTTAIIGSTGCGKSTLVKLIPRFFDVTEGTVSLGGTDVRDIALQTLRGQIGYVSQKAVLFSGDISSNIAYGAPDATQENIEEAARIAQATEFIEAKEEKYESAIAQGGTNVSGGQKQRISIARAIARDPKVYIFDDSFSALDFKTDTALRKALSEKTKDAAVIIVAQRVSTILSADQIIVLEDGKMAGKGTHRELVESCEEYRMIAKSQLSEKEYLASINASVNGKEGV
ncbi:MAG: ABC transporter ATP-binding protein [Oscillospiraceae bacterium]|nr:ABC transporter ATP-binding protein [Oscillospiraceae bacterium]